MEVEEDAAAEAEAAAQDDDGPAGLAKKRNPKRVRADLITLPHSSHDALKNHGQPVRAERRKPLWCHAEHAERHQSSPLPL